MIPALLLSTGAASYKMPPASGGGEVTFNFTEAASTTLATIDSKWKEYSSSYATDGSGYLVQNDVWYERFTYFQSTVQNNEQFIEATYAVGQVFSGGQVRYLHVRSNASQSGYRFELQSLDTTTARFRLSKNGSYYDQIDYNTGVDLSTLQFIMRITITSANLITCVVNGSTIFNTTDSSSPVTGGYPGISIYPAGTASSAKIDKIIVSPS